MEDHPSMTNIEVRLAGRTYKLLNGRWPDGSPALFLLNAKTRAGLPATVERGGIRLAPNEALVIESDGILKALEEAGAVKATTVVGQWLNLRLRVCQLMHPELIQNRTSASLADCLSHDAPPRRDEGRDKGRER